MMLLLSDFLNLNGYNSLWDKYHDKSEVKKVAGLHGWIIENKKDFQIDLFQAQEYKALYHYKKAFKNNDWDTMLKMMFDYWNLEIV